MLSLVALICLAAVTAVGANTRDTYESLTAAMDVDGGDGGGDGGGDAGGNGGNNGGGTGNGNGNGNGNGQGAENGNGTP